MAEQETESQTIRHDVFVSFRGTDTRNGFTSHLHDALQRTGVDTYVDARLRVGDEISQALRSAIDASRLAVIVLSENFASSTWCLDELAHVLARVDLSRIQIVPIFHDVDPSHVRKQTGSYGSALAEHEKRFGPDGAEKVGAWRNALTRVANLSGFDSHVIRPESRLIKEIVETIVAKLSTNLSDDVDIAGFVGMRGRVEEVTSLMRMSSPEVLAIGIWGIGGIGKTTLASHIFNRLGSEFDGRYFLANAREELEKHGLVNIRNKIFSELLEENLHLGGPVSGSNFIKQRLHRKRVLLVLDDAVNALSDLECLAKTDEWFGAGSRIILSTRATEVLKIVGVHDKYEVKELDPHHAAELFRSSAFKESSDESEEFGDLVERVVRYCKGVPLALKVIGAHLKGKSIRAWESAVKRFGDNVPHETIQKALKISYDALGSEEKDIFLDLACFFKGEEQANVEIYFTNLVQLV